jgi:hypothetical protein
VPAGCCRVPRSLSRTTRAAHDPFICLATVARGCSERFGVLFSTMVREGVCAAGVCVCVGGGGTA